jgi:hypothetical protein
MRIIASDVMGYYLYLPATFIHHDLTLEFVEKDPEFYQDKIWFLRSHTGNRVIQFTCGLALLYTPFFLAAQLLAPVAGFETNGYTDPYEIALILSCLFYMILGLYFLRKILLDYFSEWITSITLFTIVIGTNLLFYSTIEAPMSHAYSFALITVFMYLITLWYKKTTLLRSMLLGLLFGMIILIRPTNIIIILLFLFWAIVSFKDIQNRILHLLKAYPHLILMILFSFIVWIPQLLYWKAVSGQYFYNSYGAQAWFFFNDPQVVNVLFSYRKGWLLYTPVMVFALSGIPFLLRYARGTFWAVLFFILFHLYIISSWWDWWYGGSFGHRAFIDAYGVLALPLASFLKWIMDRKKWIRLTGIIILGLLIYHNTFQVTQYYNGAIHWVSMTKKAYWDSFGRRQPSDNFREYLKFPDYKGIQEKIKKIKEQRTERGEQRGKGKEIK